MIKSKSWNWDINTQDFWNIPSEDLYYYLDIWSKNGYKKFLDLGCGLGRHSIFFAKNGFEVYAFDLSEDGIEKFKQKIKDDNLQISVKLGDMLSLPYDDNYFDCILAYHSIYHTDSSGIIRVLNEIQRVLNINGEAFLTFNSKNNPSFYKESNEKIDANTIVKTEGNEIGIPHYYANLEDIKILLSNFNIKKIRQIEDIYEENGKIYNSWHYFVNVKKQTST